MNANTASAVLQHPAPAVAGAAPSTAPAQVGVDLVPSRDCTALISVRVSHGHVEIIGSLDMGAVTAVLQRWERRTGPGKGWALVSGPEEFIEAEQRISTELAEYLDRLPFPFELANMLPGKRARAEAVGAAAKVVQA